MLRILLIISLILISSNASLTKDQIQKYIPKTMNLGKSDKKSKTWEVLTSEGKLHSYLYETYELAPIAGFSGGKMNILVQMDRKGNFIDLHLLEQDEPVFVSGLGVAPFLEFLEQYQGRSLRDNIKVAGKSSGASLHIDGITKATASVKIANDSILASSIKVAKKKLRGEKSKAVAISNPKKDLFEKYTWQELLDKKLLKHLKVTKKQAEELFLNTSYTNELEEQEKEELFLDLYIADLGVPTLAKNLLKQSTQDELNGQLLITEEPILILANGSNQILGVDFVRNTSPDNLEMKQDDFALNIRDGDYEIDLLDSIPSFEQSIILQVDKRFGFDPSKKWILNTKIVRGNDSLYSTPVVKNLTLEIKLPQKYFLIAKEKVKKRTLLKSKSKPKVIIKKTHINKALVKKDATKDAIKVTKKTTSPIIRDPKVLLKTINIEEEVPKEEPIIVNEIEEKEESPAWLDSIVIEEVEKTPLWIESIYEQKEKLISVSIFLSILFIILYKYQTILTKLRYKRTILLSITLFFIGFYGQGQLSIVTVLGIIKALLNSQSLMFLLYDPFSLIIWFFVLLSLVIWGRGTFCGWLCPYGIMQEFSHYLARSFKLPRIKVSENLNNKLVNIKYFILLALISSAIFMPNINKFLVEVEPFKTSITLFFDRELPYVIYALFWLVLSMFIFKAFCRYFCPLGALLSILGKLRVLDWLPRRVECGNPCNNCHKSCNYQAIDENDGHIKYSDCFQCLDCVQIYSDSNLCKILKKDALKEKEMAINNWRKTND